MLSHVHKYAPLYNFRCDGTLVLMIINLGDVVYHQTQNKKFWLGPAKVKDVERNLLWIEENRDLKKVTKYKMKLLSQSDRN